MGRLPCGIVIRTAGAPDGFFSTADRSYDRVQRLFIECREKFFAKKVDIDAVL